MKGVGCSMKKVIYGQKPLCRPTSISIETWTVFSINVYTGNVKYSSTRLSLIHNRRLKFSISVTRYKIKKHLIYYFNAPVYNVYTYLDFSIQNTNVN